MGVFASNPVCRKNYSKGAAAMLVGWRGGMALAAVTSCGIFSAISGSSMATEPVCLVLAVARDGKMVYAANLGAGVLARVDLRHHWFTFIALLLYALITEQSVGAMLWAGVNPVCWVVNVRPYRRFLVIVFPNTAQPGKATTR